MRLPELSDEQNVLLDHGRVVEAGPGSGKTRGLVARFLASASASSRGVALLSFTNAAVDEVRRRTHQVPGVPRSPHFVGTFDSFLHRFIVTPAETPRLRRPPSYWASWDDLPEPWTTVRLKDPVGSGLKLSSFRIDAAGAVLLNESALSWEETAYLSQVNSAGRRPALLNTARARINGLTGRGTYDAGSARRKADQLLAGNAGQEILSRISRRFVELLVDEAQDCDEAEIDIIRRITATGVRTLVVADPDQAIFEFRGSDPRLFLNYRDSHPLAERGTLATNYRSTHSICAAVTALRSSGQIKANDESTCAPIYVLSGTAEEQRAKFLTALDECGVRTSDAIVLSHRRRDAMAVAGVTPVEGTSGAAGDRLAAACSVIRFSGDCHQRLAAVQAIERILLGLVDWPESLKTSSQRERLDALGRGQEWLRQAVAALVTRTAGAADADAFGIAARSQLKASLGSLPIGCLAVAQRVKKPAAAVWDACSAGPILSAPTLSSGTIHGAKGMEFDAVLLMIPPNLRKINGLDVLDECEQGINSEARRVLYVGASRARRMLAFGVGPHSARVRTILGEGTAIEIR